MKLETWLILTAGMLLSVARAAEKPVTTVANATNRFAISGMTCSGCAGGLKAELKNATGVASADVSLTNKLATVAYDTNLTSSTKLMKVISEAGFEGKPIKP